MAAGLSRPGEPALAQAQRWAVRIAAALSCRRVALVAGAATCLAFAVLSLLYPRLTPTIESEAHFTGQPSPQPAPLEEPIVLGWGTPFAISWNVPIHRFSYTVMPPTESRGWVSPDRRAGYVFIERPRAGATYSITIISAEGANGVRMQRPALYRAVAPHQPHLLEAEAPILVELGKPAAIQWNVPIETIDLEISPAAPLAWQVDPDDPTVVLLSLNTAAQGARYELTIHDATAESGAPLGERQILTLTTPPPLAARLEAGRGPVPIDAQPILAFDAPIADFAMAEAAITIDPPRPGAFEWTDGQRARWIPAEPLPYETRLTFRIPGGMDGPRSTFGSYLQEDAELAFRTVPNKTIDVSLSRQIMTLFEGDDPVRTFVVSTGIPGADTPIGEFRVQYKLPTARFRGVNSATGHRYDLPNVKWVLAFMGDYTIHGAYWRQAFGRPGSNGCVSLTDSDARIVFDWAPEGTLIRIHS